MACDSLDFERTFGRRPVRIACETGRDAHAYEPANGKVRADSRVRIGFASGNNTVVLVQSYTARQQHNDSAKTIAMHSPSSRTIAVLCWAPCETVWPEGGLAPRRSTSWAEAGDVTCA